MPSILAFLALLAWPMVTVWLFRALTVERAVIWSILGGYLLLPPLVAFDFPMIPPLDKFAIANLSAWAVCTLMLGHRVPLMPTSPVGRVLMVLFIVSPFMTVVTNGEPLVFVQAAVPGLRIYDSVASVISQAMAILPFFLGRRFLGTEGALRDILVALVVAGLAYSVPMLIEIRLSPQLNMWIYGFYQHDFVQMMRYGGFRPMVFLPHGLWVAFFGLMSVIAAVALWRLEPPALRGKFMLAAGYLLGVLVLCKTAGVLLYAAVAVPIVRWLSPSRQVRIAGALAAFALLYPLLRGADLVPVDWVVEQAQAISPARAQSLQFRLDNEDLLLARASEKPLFGWGGYGRNQLHDPVTGELSSTLDGRWILVIGVLGWLGYIVEFGLLALPLLLVARQSLAGRPVSPWVGPVAMILGVNMLDLIPNATLVPFTWLLAGAVLGYAEVRQPDAEPAAAATADAPVQPRTIL